MKVLILSVPAGGGHLQTARAVSECLTAKGAECEIVDIAINAGRFTSTVISKGYNITTAFLTTGYRIVYNLSDKRTKHSYSLPVKLLNSACCKKLYERIKNNPPDVVVSTHPFTTIVWNVIAKKHNLKQKVISIVTDFTVQPTWEQAVSDYVITASELLDYQCIKKWGTTHNVLPLGIPIREEFTQKMEKTDARATVGIEDKFTVLIMMGSMGFKSAAKKIVKKLDRMTEDFQVLVVCGNNKRLFAKLKQMETSKDLIVLGFANNVPQLMDASDCIITKPGGLSSSEALAKNIPMVLTCPIPGHEDRNSEFITNNGAGIALSKTFGVEEAVYQLIHFPDFARNISENAQKLAKPTATSDLAELILKQ